MRHPTRVDRLALDEGAYQEVRIRQEPPLTRELFHQAIRVGQQAHEVGRSLSQWWQGGERGQCRPRVTYGPTRHSDLAGAYIRRLYDEKSGRVKLISETAKLDNSEESDLRMCKDASASLDCGPTLYGKVRRAPAVSGHFRPALRGIG